MDEDHPPLFVNLAAELDKNGGILESLLVRLDIESLRRGLDLIKDHLDLFQYALADKNCKLKVKSLDCRSHHFSSIWKLIALSVHETPSCTI